MKVDLFDFDLPNERIALRPVRPRDAARMLVVRGADAPFEDRGVRDLPQLLNPGDVLVFNDTRVIPAQLALLAMGFLGPESDIVKQFELETDARSNVKADHGKFTHGRIGNIAHRRRHRAGFICGNLPKFRARHCI